MGLEFSRFSVFKTFPTEPADPPGSASASPATTRRPTRRWQHRPGGRQCRCCRPRYGKEWRGRWWRWEQPWKLKVPWHETFGWYPMISCPEPEPCWFFLTFWEIYNLITCLCIAGPWSCMYPFKVCHIHVYTHDFICISSAYRWLRYDNHPSKVSVELGHICCGPWRICFTAAWHLASVIATKQWNRVEQIHGISLCACWNGQPWEWWK